MILKQHLCRTIDRLLFVCTWGYVQHAVEHLFAPPFPYLWRATFVLLVQIFVSVLVRAYDCRYSKTQRQ